MNFTPHEKDILSQALTMLQSKIDALSFGPFRLRLIRLHGAIRQIKGI